MPVPRRLDDLVHPSRRTFVKGLATCGAAASLGLLHRDAAAAPGPRLEPGVLSGADFDLRLGATRVNVTGRERTALTINGSLPKKRALRSIWLKVHCYASSCCSSRKTIRCC